MGLFNFRKKEEKKEIVERSAVDFGSFLPLAKLAGTSYPLFLAPLFRAVDLISDSVAMLPVRVVKKDKESEIIEHYIYTLFEEGLNGMNKFNFFKTLITDVLTKGNGYAYIIRKEGKIDKLMLLPPESVTPQFVGNTSKISSYICSILAKSVYPEDMIHLVRHFDNSYNGRPNTFYADRTIKGASAAENLSCDNFQKGGIVKGILTSEKNLLAQQKEQIHKDWARQMGTSWFQSMGNPQQDGIAVLQDSLKFQPIQTSASEAQLLQSRQFYVEEVARFFGINPVLLGDLSHTSWQSLEAAQQDFVLHCLQGWIIMVEEELTKKLLTPIERTQYKFDLDEKVIIKTDKQAEANYYSTLLTNGVLSINEVRHAIGLEDIEGGDKHIIPFTDVNQNQINNKENEGTKEL